MIVYLAGFSYGGFEMLERFIFSHEGPRLISYRYKDESLRQLQILKDFKNDNLWTARISQGCKDPNKKNKGIK